MMQNTNLLYLQYKTLMQKIADIKYASAVLQWDQETYMPTNGEESRSRQLATLSEVAHKMFTDDKTGDLLNALIQSENLSERQQKNVSISLEDFHKQKKFSSDFVRKLSEAVSSSFHAWIKARKENSFAVFEPALSALVELKKQEADLLGYEGHPYNAMMNEYEKGATVQMVDKIFGDIVVPLRELLTAVENKQHVNDDFLHQYFPKQTQWEWGQYIARQLGYDFSSGRQDIAEHPFTINFSSRDVRITTRIDENDFANMTWSTIHEVGHALYEQGLPNEEYGLPLGEYTSLSIHESQSRLWENCVCRGKSFWQYYFPILKNYFPDQFHVIGIDHFIAAINKVKPTLVRTEADELTYHFHVMVRYELEKCLFDGTLLAKDIPYYWNSRYKDLLGLQVPNDKLGCLQDVHWSHGSFGYFPTYSLGSFYAAQFWQQAKLDIPDLENHIALEGQTALLLQWLRNNIHHYGKQYNSEELCKKVTNSTLDSKVFMSYVSEKLK